VPIVFEKITIFHLPDYEINVEDDSTDVSQLINILNFT